MKQIEKLKEIDDLFTMNETKQDYYIKEEKEMILI